MANQAVLDSTASTTSAARRPVAKDTSLTSVLTVAAVGMFFSILAVALAGLTLSE
jgi:hypothetical protein